MRKKELRLISLPRIYILNYIRDFSDSLSSNAKLLAADTSLFSVVRDINTSAIELNNDPEKINDWVFQWKMTFNPDSNKESQEIIFNIKLKKATHPNLLFSNYNVSQVNSQKHLGVI